MAELLSLLPPTEKGYLPPFIFVAAVAAIGNALQNLVTLHYTRRIYNGRFVRNPSLPPASAKFNPEDSLLKIKPASSSGKDVEKSFDQVSPLAARLFGTYTIMAGLIRLYACYHLDNAIVYQLAIWTHIIAGIHFTSEWLMFKTIKFTGPQAFPFATAYLGGLWMVLQYSHYVVN